MRVYVDTSVIGGVFDKEFMWQTKPFWDAVNNGEILVVVSSLLRGEITDAPPNVRDFFNDILKRPCEYVTLSQEAEDLANTYIAEKVIGKSNLDDARHIAMATIANADVLVSWNFKHVVNVKRILGYNAVNRRLGYPVIEIRTPPEIMDYENDDIPSD